MPFVRGDKPGTTSSFEAFKTIGVTLCLQRTRSRYDWYTARNIRSPNSTLKPHDCKLHPKGVNTRRGMIQRPSPASSFLFPNRHTVKSESCEQSRCGLRPESNYVHLLCEQDPLARHSCTRACPALPALLRIRRSRGAW